MSHIYNTKWHGAVIKIFTSLVSTALMLIRCNWLMIFLGTYIIRCINGCDCCEQHIIFIWSITKDYTTNYGTLDITIVHSIIAF